MTSRDYVRARATKKDGESPITYAYEFDVLAWEAWEHPKKTEASLNETHGHNDEISKKQDGGQ